MINKGRIFLAKLYHIGFVHIFSTSIINKVLSLATNMIIVRALSKAEYGYYSFAFNIITIVMIFSDLGTNRARFQYCCETNSRSERRAITKYLITIGSISNLLFGAFTLLYASFLPLSIPLGKAALQMLSLFTIFQFFYDQICFDFRIEKENKRFAYLTNVNSLLYLAFSAGGAFLFGITGTIVGRYLAFVIPVAIGLYWRKGFYKDIPNYLLSSSKKTAMIKYGLIIMLTNCVSSVLSYLDTYLVGRIIADEIVLADYKVATLIPHALSFFPMAIITLIYPYFVQHQSDHNWILEKTRKIQILTAIPNMLIMLTGVIFANQIVGFVFGKGYETAVPVFRVMLTCYFVSATFRIIYGNVLSMLHLVKVNFILSSIECIINIFTDIVLIKSMGSIGAAYSTIIITIMSSIFSGVYFRLFLKRKESA